MKFWLLLNLLVVAPVAMVVRGAGDGVSGGRQPQQASLQERTSAQPRAETIEVDLGRRDRPFSHFWERMFGSGRAVLSLRESYRRDLRDVKAATGFEYVRFHAIFHDEVGVYDEAPDSRPIYNFSYVDQIYD